MIVIKHKGNSSGFALLMTLLVISVIIPVVLTILDVTAKQVRLTGTSRDSEVAFHAANAGLECAQMVRRTSASQMESAQSVTASCFGESGVTATANTSIATINNFGEIVHYSYQFSWGTAPLRRCSQIDTLVLISETNRETRVNSNSIRGAIPSYPGTGQKICPQSGVCTIISSRGYNRECPSGVGGTFPAGTIQREVLLEY